MWNLHTEAEHLKHWWGPEKLKMLSCKVDLWPGGMFHYGMETPDGHKMWGRFIFQEIVPLEKLSYIVSFSDETGGITRHPMSDTWPFELVNILTLSEHEGKTMLRIIAYPLHAKPNEVATFEGSFGGVHEGFNGTYDQLDEYLSRMEMI